MANHIQTLQNRVTELEHQRFVAVEELLEFRAHLLSAKFQGTDTNGERKDWIATADVLRRIEAIRETLC